MSYNFRSVDDILLNIPETKMISCGDKVFE